MPLLMTSPCRPPTAAPASAAPARRQRCCRRARRASGAVRAPLQSLTRHELFDGVVLLAILVNCVCLAMYDPLNEDDATLEGIQYGLLILFTAEMGLKLAADGVVGYLENPWNLLDGLVVAAGWMETALSAVSLSGLRALRALRPLRTIDALPGIKMLVVTLLNSVPLLADVLVLLCFLFLIFGAVGLQLFAGELRGVCMADDGMGGLAPLADEYRSCGLSGSLGRTCPEGSTCVDSGVNINLDRSSFDNFAWSCLLIFQVVTLSGWHVLLFHTADGGGGFLAYIYYILLVLIGAYFTIQLLVAVISAKFSQAAAFARLQKQRARELGDDDEEDTRLVARVGRQASQMASAAKTAYCGPLVTLVSWEPPWMPFWRRVIDHDWFGHVVLFFILANTLTMSIEHYGMNHELEEVLDVCNLVFTIVFLVEMAAKFLGLGIIGYWKDSFNVLDGVVNIMSVVELAASGANVSALRTLRLLRVLRSLKVLNRYPDLKRLTVTALKAFASLGDFSMLVALFTFVFCVLGMQMFGGNDVVKELQPRRTFDSFGYSLLTLFETLTTSGWDDAMRATMEGTSDGACVFWVCWIVLGNFILLSLFLAILIDNLANEEGEAEEADTDEAECVRSNPLFKRCSANVVQSVLGRSAKLTLKPGATVIRKGAHEDDRACVFVVGGSVTRVKEGDEVVNFAPGASFGEAAIAQPDYHWPSDFVAGESGATVYKLHRLKFKKVLQDHPACFGHFSPIMKRVCQRIQRSNLSEFAGAVEDMADWLVQLGDDTYIDENVVAHCENKEARERKNGPSDFQSASSAALAELNMFASVAEEDEEPATPLQTKEGGSLALRLVSFNASTPKREGDTGEGGELEGAEQGELLSVRSIGSDASGTTQDIPVLSDSESTRKRFASESMVGAAAFETELAVEEEEEKEKPPAYTLHRALYCLPPQHPLRLSLIAVTSSSKFEAFIMFLIAVSSVFLALDEPNLDEDGNLYAMLRAADVVFTIAFLVEMLLKIGAQGFALHEGAYVRSGWNCLDMFIVITSLPGLAGDDSLTILRTFRLVRVLRPLRAVSRIKGLQIVVEGLIRSIPAVSNVLVFGLFINFIFGILAVQLFGGKLYYCSEGSIVSNREECVGFFSVTSEVYELRQWRNRTFHFDSLLDAMLTLFMVSTLDSWTNTMWACMDSRGEGKEPSENHQPAFALFFVIYVVVSVFFWVNLLVSVVVDFYTRASKDLGENLFETAEQQEWKSALQLKSRVKGDLVKLYNLPKSGPRHHARKFVMHPKFEFFIMGCIAINALVMITYHDGQGSGWDSLQEVCGHLFVWLFAAEAAAKLFALFPRCYFADSWNVFDFVVVVVSFVTTYVVAGGGLSVLRILRLGRFFKIVKSVRGLRAIFNTLVLSLPSIVNVGSLLCLMLFMFAVLGMNLFNGVDQVPGSGIDANMNFETFGNSLITIVTVFTGATVYGAVEATYKECDAPLTCEFVANQGFECSDGVAYPALPAVDLSKESCETNPLSPFYFISFFCLGGYIMLNVIIAVVLESFVDAALDEGLLGTSTIFETVRRKMLLDAFLRSMRTKITQYRALKLRKGDTVNFRVEYERAKTGKGSMKSESERLFNVGVGS